MSAAGTNDPVISGSLRASDWVRFKAALHVDGDPARWEEAFRLYYSQRLELRYLHPIKLLQDHGTYQGEGFSIVAIQCSLLEFLAATLEGKSYRFMRKGQTLNPVTEYSKSSEIFIRFLISAEPFRRHFDIASAADFYENIRCGILHEASTKNGWTITAKSSSGNIIDAVSKVVYRDNFQTALLAFVEDYGRRLPKEAALQSAFLRKLDSLCL